MFIEAQDSGSAEASTLRPTKTGNMVSVFLLPLRKAGVMFGYEMCRCEGVGGSVTDLGYGNGAGITPHLDQLLLPKPVVPHQLRLDGRCFHLTERKRESKRRRKREREIKK